MLASKMILRRSVLPIVPRPYTNTIPTKARALHLFSGPLSGLRFRPASTPLSSRIRLGPSLTAVRFNSSIPPSPPVSSSPPSTAAAVTSSSSGGGSSAAAASPPPDGSSPDFLDGFIPDSAVGNVASPVANGVEPNTMGYLHSLGIDFGWGTTTCIQNLLEAIHVSTGLPWWGTIMATILLIRAAQFPFYCKLSSNAARMKEVTPLTKPMMEKMKVAQATGDSVQMMELRSEIQRVFKVAGVNRLWLLFPFTQIPIFYGFYKTLYAMAEIKVPGLASDGLGWIQDWSVADPYLVLPAVASSLIGAQLMVGGESGANNLARSTKLAMAIGLPVLSFAVTHSWPAALGFYFAVSGTFGLLQALVLKQKWFREAWGLYPLSFEQTLNPLASRRPINIARPKAVAAAAPTKRQIGASGGFLDRLTGGSDDPNADWSLAKFTETNVEKKRAREHREYEKRRKERLDAEKAAAKLEKERRAKVRKS